MSLMHNLFDIDCVVLDTNVLINDSDAINSFGDKTIIIPMVVIEELDNLKSRQDTVGRSARTISRLLDDLGRKGSLCEGVPLPSGGRLKIMHMGNMTLELLPTDIRSSVKPDNYIIAFMVQLLDKGVRAMLVTKDTNVRLKCAAMTIPSCDHSASKIVEDESMMYSGVSTHIIDDELLDKLYSYEKAFSISEALDGISPNPNEIIILKSQSQDGSTLRSMLTRHVGGKLTKLSSPDAVFGLKPRNKEQQFSFELLLDKNVHIVTLSGKAGCGKSLLAIAAGFEQVLEKKEYDRIIVTKPVYSVGKEIGFLPGTIEEKMDPWIASVKDNIAFLIGNKRSKNDKSRRSIDRKDELFVNSLMDTGLLEVEAMSFIRGRSIPRSYIFVDEAQNLSVHEIKTLITRCGEGSKIVLCGDTDQTDNPYVDRYTNGLSYSIEKFKKYDISGHITLRKGERSTLATLASEIL